jgi:radical SAM protein with 4Fe4S-binding SPASM domain
MSKSAVYWRLFRSLVENPRYYSFLLRESTHTKVAKRLMRGEAPTERSFYPTKLDLRLVYACNLRCKMCGQWGDTGTYFDYGSPKLKRHLDRTVIERVVDELVPHGLRMIDMEGGETLLYPEIIDLFRMLKSRKLLIKPVTNGTLLRKYARDIIESRIDALHVSIDGDREAHNLVRQADWAYDATLDGLAALTEERRRARRHTPLLIVNFTMSRHNGARGLRKLCTTLAGKGLADVLSVKSNPIWMRRRDGEAYEALVQRYFGVGGLASWRGFIEDYSDFGDEAREIGATLDELKRQSFDFFFEMLPSIAHADIPRMYTDYDWNLGRTHCPVPYVEPTIDADGNVYPCNLFTDEPLSMGNVNERPFLEIWFCERFQTFRRMLAERGGLLPICNRCCQLTEH